MNKTKTFFNKALSVLLLVCLLVSNLGINTFAATDPNIPSHLSDKYTWSFNETRNAYTSGAFSAYYNPYAMLGIAGNFHIVAFGTATVKSHVCGNFLAKELIAGSNFGTNNLPNELSYIQKYTTVNGTSAAADNHLLVVGSETVVGVGEPQYDQNSEVTTYHTLTIAGTKVDKPKNFIQDKDTAAAPFIDLNTVYAQITEISSMLAQKGTSNVICSFSDENNRYIQIEDPTAAAYFNMTAAELNRISDRTLMLYGFVSGTDGTLIINVDCSGFSGDVTIPNGANVYIDGVMASISETTEFSTGKAVWNFINCQSGVRVVTNQMTGSIIAPNADILVKGNTNGTIIGNNMSIEGESHRRDFTGITDPTKLAVRGVKYLDNATADGFTFKLTDSSDKEIARATSQSDGTFIFPDINFNSAGTYIYKVFEVNDGKNRIVYDETVYDVTVVVKERAVLTGKALYVASVSYAKNGAPVNTMAFNNTTRKVEPTEIELTGVKTLDGTAPEANLFSFTLTETTEGAASPINKTVYNDGGSFSFGKIKYTEEGTYTYTVNEQTGADDGIVYDNTVYSVTVAVKENLNTGKLEAVTTIKEGETSASAIAFENISKVPVLLSGTKTYNSKEPGDGRAYDFELYSVDYEKIIKTAKNNGEGSFSFDELYFDTTGTYKYQVREAKGASDETIYDTAVYNVTVTVTMVNGALNADVTVTDTDGKTVGEDKVSFKNYSTTVEPTSATLGGVKTVDGMVMPESGQYEFLLEDITDGTHREIETVANDGGSFTFAPIKYTAEGTYVYEVSEVKGSASEVIYDETTYTATVKVVLNAEERKLEVESVTVEGAPYTDTAINFNNKTAAKAKIEGVKVFDGTLTAGAFSFSLYKKGEATPIETVTNNADGSFAFSELIYTEAGEYNYTVKEDNGGRVIDGVYYDGAEFNVLVRVEPSIDGKRLIANEPVITDADGKTVSGGIAFENKELKPTYIELDGVKTVNGTAATGSEYSFVLLETTKDSTEKIATRTVNNADGTIDFGRIDYTKADVYTYTVSEVKGSADGVLYDEAVYTVTVYVTAVKDQLNAIKVITKTVGENTVRLGEEDDIAFNNMTAVELPLDGVKTVDGKKPNGQVNTTFTFELYNADSDKVEQTATNNADGDFAFEDKLVFDKAGVYHYQVREKNVSNPSYGYDLTVYDVTITVTEENGALKAAVVKTKTVGGSTVTLSENEKITFDNPSTKVIPTKTSFAGIKTVDGATPATNGYTFVLVDTTNGKHEELERVNNDGGGFIFSDIIYNVEGTYTYTVSEVLGADTNTAYDKKVYSVSVEVTKNAALNKLEVASVTVEGAPYTDTAISFNNKTAAKATISGVKVFDGTLTAGAFSFSLYKKGEATPIETVTNNADGSFSFSELTYTEAGEYNYTVKEDNGGRVVDGVYYDGAEFNVLVRVEPSIDGKRFIANEPVITDADGKTVSGGIAFTNKQVKPVSVTLNAEKTIDGATVSAAAGDSYVFILEETTANAETPYTETVTNNGGRFSFSPIEYTKSGVYTYTVSEVKGSADGVVYDTVVYDVTVTVTALRETLNAKVEKVNRGTSEASEILFNNMNKVSVELDGVKTYNGKAPGDRRFEFELYNVGTKTVEQTKTNDADGSFKFDALTFGAAGTYTYQVREKKQASSETIYDASVYDVVIVVSETDGALSVASVTKTKSGSGVDAISFKNYSTTVEPTSATLGGVKAVDGTVMPESGQYEFLLEDITDGTHREIETVANDGGSFTFAPIKYTAEGTYVYEVSEVKGSANEVIYDETTYTATVKVVLNAEERKLEVESVTVEGAPYTDTAISFNNKTAAKATISGVKAFDGTLAAGAFSFSLYKKGEATPIETVTNNADGSFAFTELTYTEAGEYNYTVKEDNGGRVVDGVYYDGAEFNVLVRVEPSIDGKRLIANEPVITDADGKTVSAVEFTNKLVKPVSVTLNAEKTIDGETVLAAAGDSYVFILEETTANAETPYTETVTNNGGRFSFSPIEYTKSGVYTYTVSEVKGSADGVVYDTVVYDVTVTVTALRETLNAKVEKSNHATLQSIENMVFNNMTAVLVDLSVAKTLDGTSYTGAEYSFELLSRNAGGTLDAVQTISNGTFTFDALTFNKSGIYKFVIKETVGSTEGIIYDKTEHDVTVKVIKQGGKLVATTEIDGAETTVATFNNMSDVEIRLSGVKTVDGKEPADNRFTFELVNKDDNFSVVQTAVNASDGSFAFNDALSFNSTGTYNYQVREKNETNAYFNYDRAVYDVTVKVTEEGGKLKADVVRTKTVDGNQVELTANDVIAFDNTSVKVEPTETQFYGVKTLDGVSATENVYSFELIEIVNGTEHTLDTKTNDGEAIAFDIISFNAAGTYKYKIREVAGTDEDIAYDETVYEITVAVEEINNKLEVTSRTLADGTEYTDEAGKASVSFENKTKAKVDIGGIKYLNTQSPANEQFSFSLYEVKGTQETLIETVKNDADGSFAFATLKYSKEGDYAYVVKEDNGGKIVNGVYCDGTVFTVDVEVTLDTNGKLTATKTVDGDADKAIEFNNYSMISALSFRVAGVPLPGEKTINNSVTGIRAGQFRFELLMDGKVIATVENDENGDFTFRDVSIYEAGTYRAVVREMNAGQTIGGITYDTTEFKVDITVDKNGKITSTLSDDADGIKFNNTTTTKILVEKKWEDGEDLLGYRPDSITVMLYANGKDTGKTLELNDGNGWSSEFIELPSQDENGKDIAYSVKEAAVENYSASVSVGRDNYGYTKFTLTNTLEDNIVVVVDPTVEKRYEGGELREGQFEFILYSETDSNGDPIILDRKANLANGHVIFDPLFFSSEGTYRYTMKELVTDPDPRITYDPKEITAEIIIERDANGDLTSTINYYDHTGAPTTTPEFLNTYTPIDLRVQKTSKEGARQPLVGAIYALYRVNETGDNDIFIGQSTSDENGYMVFSDIQPGFWYYFREVFAPDGHTVDPYPTTPFLVNADGTLTYENELPTPATEGEAEVMSYSRTLQDIQVAFLRTMSTASFLQGASENKSDDGVKLLSATVNTLGGTTTLDDFFPSENAMPNTEVKLLETITVDGVSDYQTRISVGKIDTDTKEYVAGATMQILTTDGRLVHEWTTGSDATSVVGLLNVNTYYIIREAKAPSGYTTAADTRVYLDAYGNLITVDGADSSYAGGTMVNIYDTKLATLRYNYIIRRGARTDDASAYSLQISLIAMVISALVLAVLLVLKIKTRPSTKRADNE